MNDTAVLARQQQDRIDAAAAVLAAGHGSDPWALAERVGALEWHLGEMLALVAGLTRPAGE